MLTSSPKLQYSMYKLWLVNYAMNQLFPLQQKKCTNADSTLNRVHCCIIKWGRWYWLVRKLSTSCMCIISILPPAAEAYFWVPNGSLPQAVCWTSQQRAAWIGCSAVSLVCKLIVCCHVCPCIVCVLVFAFGLISTAEFRNSSSSERERKRESARYEQVGEKMELQQII